MNQRILKANGKEEVIQFLEGLKQSSFFPTLAFIFVIDKSLSFDLVAPFYEEGVEVFATCSAEVIYNDSKSEFALIALVLAIPRSYFSLVHYPAHSESYFLGNRIARDAKNQFLRPALLMLVAFKDLSFEPEKMIEGILDIDSGLKIFGGIASSFGNVENPPFYTKYGLETHGVCVLIFDEEKIQIHGLAVSGWQELGTPKKVTKSIGRKVSEIEGEPATDFYAKYFGFNTENLGIRKNHIDPDLLAASEFPLLIRKEDGSEVLRVAIQMDSKEKSVSYGGDIPEGSLVRFCSPNTMETIQHSYQEMFSFRTDLQELYPDFILMFNCAVRSRSLGPYMNLELNAIHKLWNRNVIGFSSWGEIGNSLHSKCGLHNTVISVVAIRSVEDENRDDFERIEGNPGIIQLEPASEVLTMEEMKREIDQLRRDKRILGHFLRLTSDDLEQEELKSSTLLLNILPKETASRLRLGEVNISERVPSASVLFADLVGFTSFASKIDPEKLVIILNQIFTSFDDLTLKYGVEKIKTIGDAYMVASGVPNHLIDHADRCIQLGKEMISFMKTFSKKENLPLKIRIGINSGEVTAGVIGKHKFTYDLWGDTVNVAQRMEASGLPNCIQISRFTYDLISEKQNFISNWIEAKGLGKIEAFLMDLT
ncbi:adenylate/guanylate cyclase domain-containing protein [Leptospira jelokensis]|uniref:Guanylate cyclase domain-containing protein n=1 Tax=Leptospira jelokensis TaxID=2484931 RepID=A0A4Z1A321_9LEPT|nr:adenylate/guanylate cyclase domain-containing protein [Leptospira jelokensis]TGL67803.1 hypothetical protein EHQ62_08360 [Leptospira jelokensis]